MTEIHPTAIVEPGAQLGTGVVVGPYSIVKGTVTLEDGVEVKAHVYLDGNTRVGENTTIWPFASIGTKTQDLKYRGETTYVEIGRNCQLREYVTINSSTKEGSVVRVGDDCTFLIGSHVAHDCEIGNHVVISNNAALAGHVIVGDHAVIGAMAGVHQFCRIGAYAMVGAMSLILWDVTPYSLVAGNPPKIGGLNLVGLKRKGFSFEVRKGLSHAYRLLYRSDLRLEEALVAIEKEVEPSKEVQAFLSFCKNSRRGLTPHGKDVRFRDLEKNLSSDESEEL